MLAFQSAHACMQVKDASAVNKSAAASCLTLCTEDQRQKAKREGVREGRPDTRALDS